MYIALRSFSGVISMAQGEIREIPNLALANSLIKSKLIKEYKINSNKALESSLNEANETIEKLTKENDSLTEEIEKYKALLESKEEDTKDTDEALAENELESNENLNTDLEKTTE